MKIELDPHLVTITTVASFILSGSASAHPGHYGHGVDPSATTTGILEGITSLGPFGLGGILACVALYLSRGIYRNLP
jgi:hypothetical protein